MNVIYVEFSPAFRAQIANHIRYYGVESVKKLMLDSGYRSSFVNVLTRSILGKEGW